MSKERLFTILFVFIFGEQSLSQDKIVMKGYREQSIPGFVNIRMYYDKDSNLLEYVNYRKMENGTIDSSINKFNTKGKETFRTDFYRDTTTIDRNFNGDIIKIKTFNNGDTSYSKEFSYVYNDKNQLTKKFLINDSNGIKMPILLSTNEYDETDRLLKTNHLNNGSLNEYDYFNYDTNGNLVKLLNFQGDCLFSFEEYKYDITGKLIEEYISSDRLLTKYIRNNLNQILFIEQYKGGELWMKNTNVWNGKILIKEINFYYDTSKSNDHYGSEIIEYIQE